MQRLIDKVNSYIDYYTEDNSNYADDYEPFGDTFAARSVYVGGADKKEAKKNLRDNFDKIDEDLEIIDDVNKEDDLMAWQERKDFIINNLLT